MTINITPNDAYELFGVGQRYYPTLDQASHLTVHPTNYTRFPFKLVAYTPNNNNNTTIAVYTTHTEAELARTKLSLLMTQS